MTRIQRHRILKWTVGMLMLAVCWVMVGCGDRQAARVDRLNERAYDFHYRNLDSTQAYARRSLSLAADYDAGAAEALNHLAFVCLAKMLYAQAERLLEQVAGTTDNQVELLVADIQMMRLCQRRSRNKDFYAYRERAMRRLRRFDDEPDRLTPHQMRRMVYARSEFAIVASSYFYYVGQVKTSVDALEEIDPFGEIQQDTAQLLCYWYNIGAGGILSETTPEETAQAEFEYLVHCYTLSVQADYPFWKAQAMQAMSEHLQAEPQRSQLIRNNLPAIRLINTDGMPEALLAGNLAQRSLDQFRRYGDVYQTAGANRTLAECYWQIHDYRSALLCLQRALNTNKAIRQAPDLVASIREQLSLVYSAVNDKVNSDRNRNIYLDLQEQTRQDRQLEARASQLDESARQLNGMLVAVILMIAVVTALLYVFDLMRRRSDARFSLGTLLEPLTEWRRQNEQKAAGVQGRYDEIQEQTDVVRLHLKQNKRRNLEQRAKIQLVNSVMPFIDRMMNEVARLQAGTDAPGVRRQRYQYIAELTESINDYNNVLTRWIQMRQGEVSLKIESFDLQSLFDIVARARMNYQLKGITLNVEPTQSVVKADKTLTLFMINTMADNARKFTPEGGTVSVGATETDDYVEVSVTDNGRGMSGEQLAHVFDRTYTGGHGFGLKNCNGIIEKYKKMSRIFSVCTLKAESEVGRGSRFYFRLPRGVARLCVVLAMAGTLTHGGETAAKPARPLVGRASQYADSAYFSNINGTYERTLQWADSCRKYLAPTDTVTLLDISNEAAVAALALHRWDVYQENNRVYTRLFREVSADTTLPEYVRTMQRSENNKTVAVILLSLLLVIIFPAYYFLYYRHRLNYSFCIDHINAMNRLLLKDVGDTEKLQGIDRLGDFRKFDLSDEQQENLSVIVRQIHNALQLSIDSAASQETTIELAEDNLRRLQMDTDRLHVSNSVLDNCLSTLKHETMYYPSRIRQLIDGTDAHLAGIAELVGYYQELYQILSQQAMRQIPAARLDDDMTAYLFEILKKLNNGEKPEAAVSETRDRYVDIQVQMDGCVLNDEQCRLLFTPYTADLKFLLCRQIVREMGEATGLRGCGIRAEVGQTGPVVIVTMPVRCLEAVRRTNHILIKQ